MTRSAALAAVLTFLASAGCGSASTAPPLLLYANGHWGNVELADGTSRTIGPATASGTTFTTVAVADTVTGGIPSLEVATSGSTSYFEIIVGFGSTNGTLDLTPYRGGHLQFDLELLALDATSVRVSLVPPLGVELRGRLTGAFAHVSVPLTPDLYGTGGPRSAGNGAPLLLIQVDLPSASPLRPIYRLNDVRWTAD